MRVSPINSYGYTVPNLRKTVNMNCKPNAETTGSVAFKGKGSVAVLGAVGALIGACFGPLGAAAGAAYGAFIGNNLDKDYSDSFGIEGDSHSEYIYD